MNRKPIAYYSRRGENYVDGRIQTLAVGNTEIAAGLVQMLTQADIFRIEPVREYSPDYCRCIDQARQDLYHGARLELKRWPDRFGEYNTVYLGYPIWWGIAAWPADNFVKSNDFTGKTVIPFCTSSSSGLGESGELLAVSQRDQ